MAMSTLWIALVITQLLQGSRMFCSNSHKFQRCLARIPQGC
jgi:hypothetical protein